MSIFDDILNKPVTWREWLNPRMDVSVWASIARAVRGPWRRFFHPNGPAWFKHRISTVGLIMALQRCSFEEALIRQKALDDSRLRTWLKGF